MNASLSRLGVSSVYALLLHRPNQLLGANGILLYKALRSLKDHGQVIKIGISIYSISELDNLIPRFYFDLVQTPFNLLDHRLYNSGWLHRLKDYDIEVHARSVFLQGLLLMRQSERPAKFMPWENLWRRWHNWLQDHQLSALQACLAFPLSFPQIDKVVVGANSVQELSEIISASKNHTLDLPPNLQCEDENLINPANWPLL